MIPASSMPIPTTTSSLAPTSDGGSLSEDTRSTNKLRPITDDDAEAFREEEMETQGRELREAFADDLGGEPADDDAEASLDDCAGEPVVGAGESACFGCHPRPTPQT